MKKAAWRSAVALVAAVLVTVGTAGAGAAVGANVVAGRHVAAGPTFTWSTATLQRGFEADGIWARTASDAWSVGLQPGGRCQYQTLTVHWNGSTWSVVPSPSRLSVNSTLASVSGTSTNDVWAVGESGCSMTSSQTLVLHWNGSSWAIVKTPNPGSFPTLSAVAARTGTDAWAVGGTVIGAASFPVIEHWNGTSWQVSKVSSSLQGVLDGVAALGATDVWAVGSFAVGASPLDALHWNGKSWSPVPVPVPRGSTAYLSAITALPHGQAVAVGQWRPTQSTAHVLIETWNGTAWHMTKTPAVPGFSGLYSVAAAPGQGPWASGFTVSTSSGGAVVLERVNGTWQLANPPALSQIFGIAGASDGQVWGTSFRFIAHGVPG